MVKHQRSPMGATFTIIMDSTHKESGNIAFVKSGPQSIPIIRTKLYRPPEPENLVCRQALHEQLDAGLKVPLTLVAAPAGYGKSTAVAHWLEALDTPSAWVSLDEGDGDLQVFLQ